MLKKKKILAIEDTVVLTITVLRRFDVVNDLWFLSFLSVSAARRRYAIPENEAIKSRFRCKPARAKEQSLLVDLWPVPRAFKSGRSNNV